MDDEIKFLRRPVDTLRLGLAAARDVGASSAKHPVQVMQEERASGAAYAKKLETMARAHGGAIPAKLDAERQILTDVERLPGPVPSKRLGLQILTGDIDRFGFEDYLNPEDMRTEGPRSDAHAVMEAKLGLGPSVGRF